MVIRLQTLWSIIPQTHAEFCSLQNLRHQRALCHCGYFRHAWQRCECAALPESLLLSPLRHLRARQTFLRSESRTSVRIWNMTGNISCDLWIVTQTVRTIPTQLAHLFLCSGATQSLSPLARSLAHSLHHPLCLYSESCTRRVCLSFKLDRLFMSCVHTDECRSNVIIAETFSEASPVWSLHILGAKYSVEESLLRTLRFLDCSCRPVS